MLYRGLWNVWLMSGQEGGLVVPSSGCRRWLAGGDGTSVQRREVGRVVANLHWTVAVVGVVWALSLDCEWLGWVCDAAEAGQH